MGSFLRTNAYVHVEALENREKRPRVVLPPRELRELETNVVPVAQLTEATTDILDKLEELEEEEQELRAEIATDLELKAKLEEKLQENHV
ncbi:hypothetical protein Pyn_21863 [Prunus yedoensis var. nudiflora]|uniref:Uncharacterized protein n=1 Tax=Prunus yedoensis var. nudiflora TaxID=2094558 RepID=A0A314XWW0_PRUYE|nr:hypothetical protein Pyn_21863 [Prunus yedoensis var. nudiflora]